MNLIDETFSGLLNPAQVIAIGRTDVTERPGDLLLQLVADFGSGGFRSLAEEQVTELDDSPVHQAPRAEIGRNLSKWFESDEMDGPDLD